LVKIGLDIALAVFQDRRTDRLMNGTETLCITLCTVMFGGDMKMSAMIGWCGCGPNCDVIG